MTGDPYINSGMSDLDYREAMGDGDELEPECTCEGEGYDADCPRHGFAVEHVPVRKQEAA